MLQITHLIEQTSQGPNVCFVIIGFESELFGRHVVRCSNHCVGELLLFIQHLGNPKVPQPNLPPCQENILCLQVPMQNLLLVHVEQGQTDLDEPVYDLVLFKPPAVSTLDPMIHISPCMSSDVP